MSHLLLLFTDLHQQVEDCVRHCPPTMYWPPSTSWRLCQTLSSSYHVMTSINKLKIVSDVFLLPCTDLHQQVEDCVRRCPPTMYWPPSTSWRLCQTFSSYHVLTSNNKLKIVSDVVLLPCTDLHQQAEDCVRRCPPPTMYWPPSTSWRLCQTLSSYHVLTSINKLKIVSDVVLLLPCTDLHQQVEDCVRRCPFTKYCRNSPKFHSKSYKEAKSIPRTYIIHCMASYSHFSITW